MNFRTRPAVSVDGRLCIWLALLLLLFPLPWVLACIGAALIHELCHAVAILLQNGRIYSLRITPAGVRMEATPLQPSGAVLSALAGPLGSAFMTILAPIFPRIAFCGAVHCLFNLLPLFPLDGGRVLQNLLLMCIPERRASLLFEKLQKLIRILLAVLCLTASLRWGVMLAVASLLLLLRQRPVRTV